MVIYLDKKKCLVSAEVNSKVQPSQVSYKVAKVFMYNMHMSSYTLNLSLFIHSKSFFVCMNVLNTCLYVHLVRTCSCRSLKRASDSLKLELCMFLSYHMSVGN